METAPLPVWRSQWWSSRWSWRSTERSLLPLRRWGSLHPCCRDWMSSVLSLSECSCWSETAPVLLLLHPELKIEDHLLPNAWPNPQLLSDTHKINICIQSSSLVKFFNEAIQWISKSRHFTTFLYDSVQSVYDLLENESHQISLFTTKSFDTTWWLSEMIQLIKKFEISRRFSAINSLTNHFTAARNLIFNLDSIQIWMPFIQVNSIWFNCNPTRILMESVQCILNSQISIQFIL